jgi:hypothetical protein
MSNSQRLTFRLVMLRTIAALLLLAGAEEAAQAVGIEGQATVAFTPHWASTVRDLRRFTSLEQAIGVKGRLIARERAGPSRRSVFEWTGRDHAGRLRAYAYEDGSFAAVLAPVGATGEIVFNSFGAFICPMCSPPANACGLRPSWIPHDLHWDNFDCFHTLIGPQTSDFDKQP